MGVKEQKGNIPVTIAVDILLNFKRFFPLTTIYCMKNLTISIYFSRLKETEIGERDQLFDSALDYCC